MQDRAEDVRKQQSKHLTGTCCRDVDSTSACHRFPASGAARAAASQPWAPPAAGEAYSRKRRCTSPQCAAAHTDCLLWGAVSQASSTADCQGCQGRPTCCQRQALYTTTQTQASRRCRARSPACTPQVASARPSCCCAQVQPTARQFQQGKSALLTLLQSCYHSTVAV